jgi:surface antigen
MKWAVVFWIGCAVALAWAVPRAFATGPERAYKHFGYPYPQAPDCDEASPASCPVDIWGAIEGQCTSWVSFRLNQRGVPFTSHYRGIFWGNAGQWAAAAPRVGVAVDHVPAVGAVAWYLPNHVAYVERVNSRYSVVLSEMNYDNHGGFREITVTGGNRWPAAFIHVV